MSDEPENPVLRAPRRIDERIGRMQTRRSEPAGRTGLPEYGYAGAARRPDQIGFRMERVDSRLDLIGGPTA